MTRTVLALALPFAVLPFGVRSLQAQDDAPMTRFIGNIGYVSTGGNTSVSTLNIGDKFVIQTPDKRVVFTQTLNLVYGRADGETNAENYRAGLRLDYGIGGAAYLFALAGWDRNVFGGIARRFEETVGVAYRAMQLPSDELTLEFGLSLFQQRNVVASDGVDDNYAAGRAGAAYKHTINKNTFV
jgi:putative salt-induced outer membrane protein YdiY